MFVFNFMLLSDTIELKLQVVFKYVQKKLVELWGQKYKNISAVWKKVNLNFISIKGQQIE